MDDEKIFVGLTFGGACGVLAKGVRRVVAAKDWLISCRSKILILFFKSMPKDQRQKHHIGRATPETFSLKVQLSPKELKHGCAWARLLYERVITEDLEEAAELLLFWCPASKYSLPPALP